LIAIISDIHGNLPALNKVMSHIKKENVRKIISLGDVAGYYPFINEVIELLIKHDVINIVGNHDRYLIDNTECPRSHTANICLKYQKKVIDKNNLNWLKMSVSKYESNIISCVHGGWNNLEDEYLYTISGEYFQDLPQNYFFCGHTHVQKSILLKKNKTFVNPGSIGQPRDGNRDAAYCLFDECSGEISLFRVPYDISEVEHKMKVLGFEEKLYENLYSGSRIGGKTDSIEYIEKCL